jgi:hypothetical protein
MAKNKVWNGNMSVEERSFMLALRMAGFELDESSVKIGYRLAILVKDKAQVSKVITRITKETNHF